MTKYDIVLVRYPFTDRTTLKKRPAVILSSDLYTMRLFGSIVIMPLTSEADPDHDLQLSEWRAAGLLKPAWVKPIIGTISTRLVEKRLGRLANSDEVRVQSALRILLGRSLGRAVTAG
jgi:mRNA interferase MazF